MFAIVIYKLVAADDVTFRHDVPVIRLAVNRGNLVRRKLKNLEDDVRAVKRASLMTIQKKQAAEKSH